METISALEAHGIVSRHRRTPPLHLDPGNMLKQAAGACCAQEARGCGLGILFRLTELRSVIQSLGSLVPERKNLLVTGEGFPEIEFHLLSSAIFDTKAEGKRTTDQMLPDASLLQQPHTMLITYLPFNASASSVIRNERLRFRCREHKIRTAAAVDKRGPDRTRTGLKRQGRANSASSCERSGGDMETCERATIAVDRAAVEYGASISSQKESRQRVDELEVIMRARPMACAMITSTSKHPGSQSGNNSSQGTLNNDFSGNVNTKKLEISCS
ncbi:hypothetical protein BC567DRAFT_24253 [Phyllosticta citribraziliensis]